MGAALVGMVVELSVGRPSAAEHADELGAVGREARQLRDELLALTDADADAYRGVVTARRLPRETETERATRGERIAEATRDATEAPLRTARAASATLALTERLAPIGNANAVSDVGVAAMLALTALHGAALNVRANVPFLASDDPLGVAAAREITDLLAGTEARGDALRRAVEGRMG